MILDMTEKRAWQVALARAQAIEAAWDDPAARQRAILACRHALEGQEELPHLCRLAQLLDPAMERRQLAAVLAPLERVAARRRVEEAFEAFDEKVRELEEQAQAQSGPERTATEQRIAALKQRRALHWERAQTASVETLPVQRAEPVGERVEKAESVSRSERARKAGRSREEQSQRTRRAEPVREPQNFFQRFFR